MKIKNILTSIVLVLSSQNLLADQIDVLFSPNSGSELKISGELVPSTKGDSKSLIADSEKASDIYTKVKNHIEGGFSGMIDAKITHADSNEVEHVVFESVSDDGIGVHTIRAYTRDGKILEWAEPSRLVTCLVSDRSED